ncbi:hypothetical protein QJQ45_024223, partial [Haematococcus lacustris]
MLIIASTSATSQQKLRSPVRYVHHLRTCFRAKKNQINSSGQLVQAARLRPLPACQREESQSKVYTTGSIRRTPSNINGVTGLEGSNMWRAWALAALFFTYAHQSITAAALPTMLPSIAADLALDDKQGALLSSGYSYFYALALVPAGLLADRIRSRPQLLGLATAAWSVILAAGSHAADFQGLLASRLGLAVAQSTQNVVGFSMVQDLYPRSKASALSLYNTGLYLGRGLMYYLVTGSGSARPPLLLPPLHSPTPPAPLLPTLGSLPDPAMPFHLPDAAAYAELLHDQGSGASLQQAFHWSVTHLHALLDEVQHVGLGGLQAAALATSLTKQHTADFVTGASIPAALLAAADSASSAGTSAGGVGPSPVPAVASGALAWAWAAVQAADDSSPWRQLLWSLALPGSVLACVLLFTVRDVPSAQPLAAREDQAQASPSGLPQHLVQPPQPSQQHSGSQAVGHLGTSAVQLSSSSSISGQEDSCQAGRAVPATPEHIQQPPSEPNQHTQTWSSQSGGSNLHQPASLSSQHTQKEPPLQAVSSSQLTASASMDLPSSLLSPACHSPGQPSASSAGPVQLSTGADAPSNNLAALLSNRAFTCTCTAAALNDVASYALVVGVSSDQQALAAAAVTRLAAPTEAFLTTFMERCLGLTAAEYGPVLATLLPAAGLIGGCGGGLLADRLDRHRLRWLVTAGATLAAAPCFWWALGAREPTSAFAALGLGYALSEAWRASGAVMVRSVVPTTAASTATSLYLCTRNLLGGLGPLAVSQLALLQQQHCGCDEPTLAGPSALLASLLVFVTGQGADPGGEAEAGGGLRSALQLLLPVMYVCSGLMFKVAEDAVQEHKAWAGAAVGGEQQGQQAEGQAEGQGVLVPVRVES